jgi:DNA-binding MarR family transcriptional regulator
LAKRTIVPRKKGDAADLMRKDIGFLWRIHVMSYLMVRPVAFDVTPATGLSLVEWRIMITLARIPDFTAQEIVQLWGLEKMAVSRSVKRLLQAGLIRRTKDPLDVRRLPLTLTHNGRRVHAAAWPKAEQHYERVTSALTAGELKQFNTIADKLIARSREILEKDYPSAQI